MTTGHSRWMSLALHCITHGEGVERFGFTPSARRGGCRTPQPRACSCTLELIYLHEPSTSATAEYSLIDFLILPQNSTATSLSRSRLNHASSSATQTFNTSHLGSHSQSKLDVALSFVAYSATPEQPEKLTRPNLFNSG
ncbi:uncharacterized protein LOC120176279 [Hibiscus syriacus]|uniref:uncharacterized protein LOC120176279 n=1 Tax=Hibiscus syriacus TaxID=106335 RepID=UPI0019249851|nr:uncharacterized protein LOC120176279 [Hibiscus syriacus]